METIVLRNVAACAVLALAVAGCGSVTTVVEGDEATRRSLLNGDTYCDSVPRIYSGVSYNFCRLHAEPDSYGNFFDYAPHALSAVFFDAMLSAVLDTAALPYALYRQSKDGSIEIQ